MDERLAQIVYTSTAVREFTEPELLEMLEAFREQNGKLGITGLLIFHECCFVQVIEGQHDPLHQLYERIQQDSRHHGVLTLIDRAIEEKEFGDWSMGFLPQADPSLSQVPGFRDFFGEGKGQDADRRPSLALKLLQEIRSVMLGRLGEHAGRLKAD